MVTGLRLAIKKRKGSCASLRRREWTLLQTVFVTAGTGYIGRPLIERLLQRGHLVHALARSGSEEGFHPGL
jgi:hypothetical protein